MAVRPRTAASQIVGRVLRGGAYANVLIDSWAKDQTRADAVLVRANVYHTLRWLGLIDRMLSENVSRSLGRLEHPVLDLLRVGTAEILLGTHPAHVVSDCVESVRELKAPKAAGLVNAVLRKIGVSYDSDDVIETDGAFPDWFVKSLREAWGEQETTDFLTASNTVPKVGVRSAPGESVEDGVAVAGIENAWLCDMPPAGATIQDPASVAVVNALDVQSGHRVLDLAAAPGGKTLHLLDLVGPDGLVVANDRHPRRARDAAKRVPGAEWIIADGRRTGLAPGSFDRILVDGPCSGLGILRRRPELRFRATPADVTRLAAIQKELIAASIPLLAPDGMLVFSVCTVTPEETVQVVEEFNAQAPVFPIGVVRGKGLLLAPHLTDTDGMYISSIRA